jgi:uncharacterized protein
MEFCIKPGKRKQLCIQAESIITQYTNNDIVQSEIVERKGQRHMGQQLSFLEETFAICRLNPTSPLADWMTGEEFTSITRTKNELSVMCPQKNVPAGVESGKGFRCIKIEGSTELTSTGILSSVATPLAAAEISLFAVATYDTDYILINVSDVERATKILLQHGHSFSN